MPEPLQQECDRLREALTWAVGLIRCNLPKTAAQHPDMRNAEALVNGALVLHTGEFQLVSARAELAERERDELIGERDRLRAALERVRTAVSAN